MKKIFTLIIFAVAAFACHAQRFEWMANTQELNFGFYRHIDAATDAQGNVYAVTSASDVFVFGTDTVYNPGVSVFSILTKTDVNGNPVFAK